MHNPGRDLRGPTAAISFLFLIALIHYSTVVINDINDKTHQITQNGNINIRANAINKLSILAAASGAETILTLAIKRKGW